MFSYTASILGTLPLLVGASFANGNDDFSWPQWDGPDRSGISQESNWSSTGKEENLWEADLGLGYSTVTVQDGRLFTMGYDKEAGLDVIWCFDPMTGERKWTHTYESAIWDRAHEGGTVNTPSIDGDVVYSLNREGNLFCLDVETGEVKWHTDLMPEGNPYGLEYPTWGFSASPLLVGDEMLLNCGRVLSIEKDTGKVLWRSEDYGHAYGTGTAFELEDRRLVAVLNGRGVGVVSRDDGSEAFFREFAGQNRGVNAATPIVIHDAMFVSSGTANAGALFAFGDGELVPVWESREMANSFSGCVKMGEHLYGYDGQVLKCIDMNGETQWQERGIGNGAVIGADNRIITMGGTGELIVCEASPEAFKELSRVKLFEAGRYWTKPILVNGIIYCRSSKGKLVARDHRPVSTDG